MFLLISRPTRRDNEHVSFVRLIAAVKRRDKRIVVNAPMHDLLLSLQRDPLAFENLLQGVTFEHSPTLDLLYNDPVALPAQPMVPPDTQYYDLPPARAATLLS